METILYVGASTPGGDPLGLLNLPSSHRGEDGSIELRSGARDFRFLDVQEPAAALNAIRDRAIDLLVIDTRSEPFRTAPDHNPTVGLDFSESPAGMVLRALFPSGALHSRIQRNRILGIVGPGRAGASAAYRMGVYQLGGVLAAPSVEELIEALSGISVKKKSARIALCLAGGGIEGVLYELGVLRALEWFLGDSSVVNFDLFCGISAGAILGAFLSNGVGPDEIARGFAGGSTRVDRIKRSEIFDVNVKELGSRLSTAMRQVVRPTESEQSVPWSVLPSGLFAGDGLRSYLRRQLERPGMNNRFEDLRRPLFVGATDQDTSQAVVFGEPGFTDIPVHRAVRASAALTPFYAPEEINGRYYTDGAFSRTTNMRVAVRQGATLVILVDPLVPVFSPTAGYVHGRGGVFGTMQGLKALVNGRFDKAVRAIREMYPEVSFYLFRPYGEEMRIMSGSPMKYFYRRQVEDVAFWNTVRKIRASMTDLTRDFARHGITFRDPEGEQPPSPSHDRFEPAALGVGL